MTILAKSIYEYLMGAYVEDDSIWVSQEELIEAFPELTICKTTSHDKCSRLWNIIQEINNEVEQIIIIDSFKYKIATREESEKYLDHEWKNRIVPKLSRYYQKVRKIKKDGQFDFLKDRFLEVFK